MESSWVESGGRLERRLRFADFSEAFAFMTGGPARRDRGAAPDWSNSWDTVDISLTTHSAGSAVTDAGREPASAIDELVR